MAFNIRQKISAFVADQTPLLEKLGGVFNNLTAGTPTPANDKTASPTALHLVAGQVDLSTAEIKNQLQRQAVREGVAPQTKSEDYSLFYLSGGYGMFPEEIYLAPQSTQTETMQLAYSGFADKAGLSEAGAREFVEQRMAETNGKIYPPKRPAVPYSDKEFAAQKTTFGKISIYANQADIVLLTEIKTREMAAAEPDAPSLNSQTASSVEQITNTITDTLDATLGTEANSIGGTLNRIGVSTLHVAGDAAEAVGMTEAAQTLHNANSGLTKQEQTTKAAIKQKGYDVPTVAKIAQEAENTPEFLHDVIEGATLGDFSEKETYGANAGKIIGGLNPAGDVRDVVANPRNVAQDKPGSYIGLGASAVGAIPIAGDIAKPIIKGEKKIITQIVEDALKTESKEVVEQVGKAEAEKLAKAEAEKAAKIEAERIAKEQAEKISNRYKEMESEGHAPARHGEKISDTQLDNRSVRGKDPITGTTNDAFKKFLDGTPMPHNYGKDATRFNSKEAMVKAESYIKNSQTYRDAFNEANRTGKEVVVIEPVCNYFQASRRKISRIAQIRIFASLVLINPSQFFHNTRH